MRAIAKLIPRGDVQPFPIICGTSAGAINAALLGTNADSFRRGVARLVRWWRKLVVTDIYRGDILTLARHAARLIGNLGGGGHGPRGAPTLLDNSPLAAAAARRHRNAANQGVCRSGPSASARDQRNELRHRSCGHLLRGSRDGGGMAAGCAAAESAATWPVEHLLASAAIPFVFPAARVGAEFFMDGSVRQHRAALSGVCILVRRRILVLAVGQFTGQLATAVASAHGGCAILRFGADRRPCAVLGVPRQSRGRPGTPVSGQSPAADAAGKRGRATRSRSGERRRVRAVSIVRPRRPRSAIRRPPAARRALPAARTRQHRRERAPICSSYLLFDGEFCARTHEAGSRRRHGTARRARRILDGASPRYLPLFPRESGMTAPD